MQKTQQLLILAIEKAATLAAIFTLIADHSNCCKVKKAALKAAIYVQKKVIDVSDKIKE